MSTLKQYLASNGISQASFAASIGVSRGYMSELVAGSKAPSLDVAARIERLSDGAVTAVSWVSDNVLRPQEVNGNTAA